MTRLAATGASLAIAALALTACTDNTASTSSGGGTQAGAGQGTLTVTSTDTECQVSASEAPSGTLKFAVTNAGSKVTEFYLLAEDGLRIVAEVENIGPGLSRDLVLKAAPGTYKTACKPGMVGDGIRHDFTVTDSGANLEAQGADKELVAAANSQYASYVKDQTEQLLTGTKAFAAAYKAGDTARAKELYAPTRVHWERIEPVAESFGDLDPMMDAREADLEPGQKWTGWHVAEKDLWPPKTGYTAQTAVQRAAIADQLVKDTETLYQRTRSMQFTADQIGNGAKGLLDEVATGKVTGEEEIWSHTDLWDFQANVDGARVAWEGLRPILKKKDAALDSQLQLKFSALQKLLDQHKVGKGFKTYDQLSKEEVKALSDAVNALSEPLSRLTAAVI
ncbi:iron uptake system protein EfeO [uncultured Arsenicicoccus sp.]|uniref:iron uptake system protein EfeO n=1 Tax=uncultured Arsenicicoccus sp. TaxID=491339 RepID=UPI002599B48B|nr:iron uptake system protein EfeO [uncultured Arsenicicoccus sp.]